MLTPIKKREPEESQLFSCSRLGKALAEKVQPVLFGGWPVTDRTLSRDALQEDAVRTLFDARRLLLQWGTGVGKSRVAVKAVQALYLIGKRRILLLVAETDHKRNWKNEFTGHFGPEWGSELYSTLTVECYQSLEKYRGTEWDMIIADEAHHLRSVKRTEAFSTLKAEYVMCVSATISDRGDATALLNMLERQFGPFAELNFSVQDGIDNRIIAEPDIYIHLLNLSDIKGSYTFNYAWGARRSRRKVECSSYEEFRRVWEDADTYPAADVTVHCSAKDGYNFLNGLMKGIRAEMDELEESTEGEKAAAKKTILETQIKRIGNQRKEFLGRCKSDYAKRLVGTLGDKRYICFCTNVDQALELGAKDVISARKSTKKNAEVISSFNEWGTNRLFAVGMLREGTNLNDIDAGVIVQLGGKERTFIQEFGRALRAKNPVQHLIVIDGTRDVDFCNIALSGIDLKYINIYSKPI